MFATLQTLVESTSARFDLKADAEQGRKLEAITTHLTRALDEKLGVTAAEKLLEHKADVDGRVDRSAQCTELVTAFHEDLQMEFRRLEQFREFIMQRCLDTHQFNEIVRDAFIREANEVGRGTIPCA